MASVFHISEEEAARDFKALVARVRAGEEVVVEDAGRPVVVMKAVDDAPHDEADAVPAVDVRGRTAEEILKRLARWESEHGPVVADEDFASELEAVHAIYNAPMDVSRWD
jgi:antitoxin (DNA-binding transcriptional repressor) of toxin-antitoxin stability system